MPKPSNQQLQLETTSASNDLPFTNYTIFRNVSFELGEVVTGWNYDLIDPLRPKSQYCYYEPNGNNDLSVRYTLAINNSRLPPSPLVKPKFNFDGAVTNCIWFSGV